MHKKIGWRPEVHVRARSVCDRFPSAIRIISRCLYMQILYDMYVQSISLAEASVEPQT